MSNGKFLSSQQLPEPPSCPSSSNPAPDRCATAACLNGDAQDLGRTQTIDEYDVAFDVWSHNNGCWLLADRTSGARASLCGEASSHLWTAQGRSGSEQSPSAPIEARGRTSRTTPGRRLCHRPRQASGQGSSPAAGSRPSPCGPRQGSARLPHPPFTNWYQKAGLAGQLLFLMAAPTSLMSSSFAGSAPGFRKNVMTSKNGNGDAPGAGARTLRSLR